MASPLFFIAVVGYFSRMKPTRLLGLTLSLFGWAALAVSSTVSSQARGRYHSADPGVFDYYLLSLSIAPSFCALSPANQSKEECRALTQSDFLATPLTVHGLWPNRSQVSVNRQPHDCDGPPFAPPPVSVQADLTRYMPGGPGLQRYEWRKHGTCSGLSPEAYFTTVVDLARDANALIGAALQERGMLGRQAKIGDLLAAVEAHDPVLARAIVVDCKQPRGGGEALIDEIRIVLSKNDLMPFPAADLGLGQNSGCPRGEGYIPEAPR